MNMFRQHIQKTTVLPDFTIGTKPIKNKGSKKNGLVILLSDYLNAIKYC
jgi:hypothetical protein